MIYIPFLKAVNSTPKSWRLGQRLFNALHSIEPIIADQIRATRNDPFYADDENDERIAAFFSVLKAVTNEPSFDDPANFMSDLASMGHTSPQIP